MEIYRADEIIQLREFYGSLVYNRSGDSIKSYLQPLADRLYEALNEYRPEGFTELRNNHPDYPGLSTTAYRYIAWKPEDAKKIIAHQYGFISWEAVLSCQTSLNPLFEQAVDGLLEREFSEFQNFIEQHPQLIQSTSSFAHGASLLHYVSSNGVELWRQQVPLDLPEKLDYLLSKDADIGATMQVYGGYFTMPGLLGSSAHPKKAGIYEKLLQVLEGH